MAQRISLLPEGSRARLGGRAVTMDDLFDMADETNATTFSVSAPLLDRQDTAILGRLNNLRCHSGLFVHAADTVEAHDLASEWERPPGVSVAIMLEGELDAYLDDVPLHLGPSGDDDTNKPTGHIWSLTAPTRLTRKSKKGMRVRKVIITVPQSWIEQIHEDHVLPNRNLQTFAVSHRAHRRWFPSTRALALAEQIVNWSRSEPTLAHMSVESHAIEIAREALESIFGDAPANRRPARARTKMQAKANSIRDYLHRHLASNPTLAVMARDLGMSVGTMQTAFKSAFGRTIADYSRELRLMQARDAIERDGASVAQAAYDAGYSNPANFSTAFKRLFGLSPSEVDT